MRHQWSKQCVNLIINEQATHHLLILMSLRDNSLQQINYFFLEKKTCELFIYKAIIIAYF
jgi:hypothetical protein